MKTSNEGKRLIKHFEGFRDTAYQCSAGVWTIGYGFTDSVKQGDTMTLEQAEKRLDFELVDYEQAVNSLITWPMTQQQFDALVSFTFNLGEGALKRSTLRKCVNAGKHGKAAGEFMRWNKAGGKVLDGLTRRRQAESDLFMSLPWRR